MGGIAVAAMFLIKQQGNMATKNRTDAELAQIKSQISALLINPAHCNANFKGKLANSSVTDATTLLSCSMLPANPRCSATVAGTTTAAFTALPETGGTPTADVNWPTGAGVNQNLKIYSIKISIAPPNLMAPPAAQVGLTSATVEVGFSERVMSKVTTAGVNTIAISGRRLNSLKFSAVVVANATTVLGCPRSWNTTVLYEN